MSRPFMHARVSELSARFEKQRADRAFLASLIAELSVRSTQAAAHLRVEAERALGALPAPVQPPAPLSPISGAPKISLKLATTNAPSPVAPALPNRPMREPGPALNNAPSGVLSAWTALEVLSPQSFQRPEDLVGGQSRDVDQLDRSLPWNGAGKKPPPGLQLYHQVVLGTVELAPALARLTTLYADGRPERPAARGEAALAVIMLDRRGRLVENAAVTVSSFGWGVVQALNDDLAALGDWPSVETALCKQLDQRLRRLAPDGEPLPLDIGAINGAFNWLVGTLGLPQDLVKRPAFALRTYQYYRNPEPPQGLLLNSFFLADLAAAHARVKAGTSPANLRRYLGALPPRERRDLFTDTRALADAVAPARFPSARWPGPGRHPLVLLQQAAVNLAMGELKDGGILAVNGPPGTGKTTLLRDVVAALVTERARAMARFDDPEGAFRHTGERLGAGSAWLHLYALDPTLLGFEMLVASSNNKAVENVSAELPSLNGIAADAPELRHLKTLSDALGGGESWGLIAAVLGNARNRSRFQKVFWWDDDHGLRRYLAEAAGTPQSVEETDPVTGEVRSRPPRIVQNEHPPRDHDDARLRWEHARAVFRAALDRSEVMLRKMEGVRQQADRLPGLVTTLAMVVQERNDANNDLYRAVAAASEAERALEAGMARLQAASGDLQRIRTERPAFLARLFGTAKARTWTATEREQRAREAAARATIEAADVTASSARQHVEHAHAAVAITATKLGQAREAHDTASATITAARAKMGDAMIDATHFARDHRERQVTAPWLNAEMQRRRDDVFVAAMALHKAFLDAAAKPMRHNLGALMAVLAGRTLQDTKRALLPDLWASLFLVTPVVSTTFASVGRMLGDLPDEALGWLLVDEAGQALPQAAIGALMRTKRALVVGDPMQVEPVVTLPSTLTGAICRRFGTDPDRYNAPLASVQTLADTATPFMAEFPARDGTRTVGVPLLVHRRCADPMFGTSNTIAYEGLMVPAKTPKRSAIAEVLGPSAWFNVRGRAEEKWCPEEGEAVVSLLRRLAAAGVEPDLYIVTPFRTVQDRLRAVIRSSGVLARLTSNPSSWVLERVGTVHTVQGREAEAVIFVLGAQDPAQLGARGWAGGKPNLLNVAVTRAKEVIYVVGNRDLWQCSGVFQTLNARLPPSPSV